MQAVHDGAHGGLAPFAHLCLPRRCFFSIHLVEKISWSAGPSFPCRALCLYQLLALVRELSRQGHWQARPAEQLRTMR